MNHDKARDFFSAYYEGTLDGGLRQQFEARLQADPQLQADYAAFAETMEALGAFADEEIEIPIFLNDRIATRLEQEEAKRSKRFPALLGWLRYGALAGVASLALVTSVMALNKSSQVSTAGFAGSESESNADHLQFNVESDGLTVQLSGVESHSLSVSNAVNGNVLKQVKLDHSTVKVPLANDQVRAALVRVSVGGDLDRALIALPGFRRSQIPAVSGPIESFAAAIADRYGVPVVVRGEPKNEIRFTFESGTALHNVETALQGSGASVDQRDGGLITVIFD